MLLPTLTLALALAAGSPDPGTLDAARAELSALAGRIETLKQRNLAGEQNGRELERCLVRAQELAAEIERRAAAEPAPAPAAPSPEELRERADALHDEADRVAAAVNELDVRIDAARRVTAPSRAPVMTRAVVAGGPVRGPSPAAAAADGHLRALLAEREQLVARLARARAAAAQADEEARAGGE
jgi:hypothetical protein